MKIRLSPALLFAIPPLILGVVSVVGLNMERRSIESLHNRYQQQDLHHIQTKLTASIINAAINSIEELSQTASNYTDSSSRDFPLGSDILFYTIYRDEIQLLPSLESTTNLVSERFYLRILANELRSAIIALRENDHYMKLITLPETHKSSLFVCRNSDSIISICALLSVERFEQLLKVAFDSIKSANTGWVLKLKPSPTQPFTENTEKDFFEYKEQLGSPISEFTVFGKSYNSRPNSLHWFSYTLAIGLPLLAIWLLLGYFSSREQQRKIQTTTHRAVLTAQLSHDLRSPLANFKLYTELIKRNSEMPEKIRRYANVLEHEAQTMNALSDRAINAATGKFVQPIKTKAKPQQLIKELVYRSQNLLENHNCAVFTTSDIQRKVLIDTTALETITLQLIENAMKYANPTQIDIYTTLLDDRLVLTVRDYGKGLTFTQIEQIFKPGFREHPGTGSGYGLGLASARYLARLNGGDIQCEGMQPGLKFMVTLQV